MNATEETTMTRPRKLLFCSLLSLLTGSVLVGCATAGTSGRVPQANTGSDAAQVTSSDDSAVAQTSNRVDVPSEFAEPPNATDPAAPETGASMSQSVPTSLAEQHEPKAAATRGSSSGPT